MGIWVKNTKSMLKSRIKSTLNKAKNFISNIPVRFSNENIVISTDESTNYYHDLAPKDNQQTGTKTYHKALSWALKNENIYNIALSGPFGSGKSTIIRSYLNRHKEIRYINISLADFMSETKESPSKIPEQELEIGILKQLFYHVSHKRIPQSRYRKLHKVGRIKQFFIILFIAIIVAAILCFNNKEAVINYFNKLSNDWNFSILTIYIILFILSLIVLLVINHWIFKFRNKINIKEINIDKAGAKNGPQDEESIFNKNLDEIIYFFEETNYKVVIIEDLDRFDSSDIFVKLRELNTILNNYERIKRRIVFIYAIKDDMFKENDRTKFFDFIIPVIPIISATNSGDLLIDRRKKDNYEDDLDEEFFEFISPYISDMRILENIYNEFILYRETIYFDNNKKKTLKLNDKKMFAILVFKNQYPAEFANSQDGKGIVKKAFDQKRNFVFKKINELEASKKPIKDKYEFAKNMVLNNAKDIKLALMGYMTGYQGSFDYFTVNYNKTYKFKHIMDESFNLEELRTKGTVYYIDSNNRQNNVRFDGTTALIGENDYIKKHAFCIQGTQQIEKDCIEKIEDINTEIVALKHMDIQEVLFQYSQEEIFNSDILENKLLVFLLRNGFIAEDYANYINNFHAQTISQNDMNFILSVRDFKSLPSTYALDNPAKVIKKLRGKEFEQLEVFNISLIEELVKNKEHKSKRNIFFNNIKDLYGEAIAFLDDCLDKSLESHAILYTIAIQQPNLWDTIYKREDIGTKQKDKYFVNIFDSATNSLITSQNRNSSIKEYFENDPDILTRLSTYTPLLKKVINSCNIQFKSLHYSDSSNEILEWIFDNGYFELNEDMISLVFKMKSPDNIEDLATQNYTAIRNLGYQPLLEKVYDDFDKYLKDFILDNSRNTEESLDSVIDIIDRAGTLELIEKTISHENVILDDLSKCDLECLREDKEQLNEVWSYWIKHQKLAYNLNNLKIYFQEFGIDHNIEQFINQGYNNICSSPGAHNLIDSKLSKSIIESNVSDEAFSSFIKILLIIENIELKEIKDSFIPIMIGEHYFVISQEFVDELIETHIKHIPLLLIEYADEISQNEITINCTLDSEGIDLIITSEKISDATKIDYLETIVDGLTDQSSEFIRLTGIEISQDLYDKTWDYLEDSKKYELFINQINNMDNDMISECLSQLSPEYQAFANRKYRHKELLAKTDYNERLVSHLNKVDYLTSFKEITYGKSLAYECWIKQKI